MSDSDNKSVSEINSTDSEEYEEKPKKSKGGPRNTRLCVVADGQYLCKRCNNIFSTKNKAYKHKCNKKEKQMLNKCMWCGLEFANRGNLAAHAFHIHGDSSYKTISNVNTVKFSCQVCNNDFKTSTALRYHIRSQHFNLQAKIPYAEYKKVNQIWFEKVQNSNKIMEIRKTGHNTLIMRTLDENTGIKVNEVNRKIIDLNHLYPSESEKNVRVICDECGKSCLKRDFKKHFEETHLNKKRHECNLCKRTFKRSYLFLQHKCGSIRRIRGVTQNKYDNDIRISSVESLTMPFR
ncbi:hypothetical protein NE865_08144 [Phthorimaea operculella]|nr:hypothetical protein NE865_08144 [Phthorimaea operculella]